MMQKAWTEAASSVTKELCPVQCQAHQGSDTLSSGRYKG